MTRRKRWSVLGVCLLLTAGTAQAQIQNWYRNPVPTGQPNVTLVAQPPTGQPAQPRQPDPNEQPIPPEFDFSTPAPDSVASATSGPSGTSNPGLSHPPMKGDLPSYGFVSRVLVLPVDVYFEIDFLDLQTSNVISQPFTLTDSVPQIVNVPHVFRGPFKITENESPKPQTRCYLTYRYFNNVPSSRRSGGPGPIATSLINETFDTSVFQNPFGRGGLTLINTDSVTERTRLSAADVHQETFGIERQVFSDDFSLGARLPLIQQTGDPALEDSDLGDVSFIAKWAAINDPESGNVLSFGMMVTTPTGPDFVNVAGDSVHPWLIQPFVGYVLNLGPVLFQGFSSVIVPTDQREAVIMSNDVGLAVPIVRNSDPDALIKFITPTVEAHLTTPLERIGSRDVPFGFPDVFVMTGGVHVGIGDSAVLSFGAASPLTGPRPFDVEGTAFLNLFF